MLNNLFHLSILFVQEVLDISVVEEELDEKIQINCVAAKVSIIKGEDGMDCIENHHSSNMVFLLRG